MILSISLCSIQKTKFSQYGFLNAPLSFYSSIDELGEYLWNKEADCLVNLFAVPLKSGLVRLSCAPKGLIEILKIEPLSIKIDFKRVPVLSEQKWQSTHEEYFHIDVEAAVTDVY